MYSINMQSAKILLLPLKCKTLFFSYPLKMVMVTLEREPSKKKQRSDTKKDAKRIKIDNFTGRNIGKMNDWMAP